MLRVFNLNGFHASFFTNMHQPSSAFRAMRLHFCCYLLLINALRFILWFYIWWRRQHMEYCQIEVKCKLDFVFIFCFRGTFNFNLIPLSRTTVSLLTLKYKFQNKIIIQAKVKCCDIHLKTWFIRKILTYGGSQ